ncbi:YdcF family protein [Synoicihabitans lomoniglobus]|uniref:YdcF family protein n=1 Tax=Synoicihabitans lomoniglobus TaxID=2909285 RepID=A0AAE9ZU39_9BACT|nr:YdcF family protein [Opitutaceae bacterium LMO-M01]WED63099.1 YdcF family protein [Opitutaceae bacterium LMO-M01]
MSLPAAEIVYRYLAPRSPLPGEPCDAIIGFGHFDLRIARHCGHLWQAGAAPRLIFTGGVGAGSADLGQPEATAFAATLRAEFPLIPTEALLIEPDSTNTGENVRFTLERARAAGWALDRVVLVATPFRQRRVMRTWQAQGPVGSIALASPPPSDFDQDIARFAEKQENLVAQLPGEIDRLISYANHGWITSETVPAEVLTAAHELRR